MRRSTAGAGGGASNNNTVELERETRAMEARLRAIKDEKERLQAKMAAA
jgi:hypothetical protein